ncbi:hypothetical protein D8Y22_00085 [Salinadaptatus halalkaliphilus]|uniref:DUF3426 domain-containing protein n=1 Tax=Salinadaptatus halalkaliphilus TaxID=2419781 RepID=A0A4S3TT36_9EURY|nr:FxLYD domain-containing protein [Salinadaptatus halalkaliphilus]THE66573.1 hypothetical protein D8Y22_00085 [Salinadaptatus halalkaliphilus]
MSRHRSTTRRRLLTVSGLGVVSTLSGCAGVGGKESPAYEDGTAEDVDGDDRTPEEMTAAEALAEQEIHESVTPLEALTIVDHEFVLEDGFNGPTVQGTVENTGDDRIQFVELRVRLYDADDAQLGRYLDTTGDLEGSDEWSFEVILLESPADIASYDVTVLGTPT